MDTLAEQLTHDFLGIRDSIQKDGVDFFDLDYPALYERRNGEWVEHPHAHGDIYLLIRAYALAASRQEQTNIDGIVLVTCGWAARLPEGTDSWEDQNLPRPSEQENRVRCAMIYALGRDGSVFSWLDLKGLESTGERYGHGALLDACDYLGLGVWKREWALGVLEWYAREVKLAAGNGDDLDADTVRWFAHRIATIQQMLGHDADLDDELDDDASSVEDLLS